MRTIADAVRSTGARTILFSGHIHAFQVLDTQAMTQVIVGTGGANPDKVANELMPPAMGGFEFEGRRLELTDGRWRAAPKGPTGTGTVQGWEGFGFTTLAPAAMELVECDAEGKRQFACDLAGEAKVPRCRWRRLMLFCAASLWFAHDLERAGDSRIRKRDRRTRVFERNPGYPMDRATASTVAAASSL